MANGDKYLPFIFILMIVLVIILVWFFFGGKEQEFIGLKPLDPNTCGQYIQNGDTWIKIDPEKYHQCMTEATKDEFIKTMENGTLDQEIEELFTVGDDFNLQKTIEEEDKFFTEKYGNFIENDNTLILDHNNIQTPAAAGVRPEGVTPESVIPESVTMKTAPKVVDTQTKISQCVPPTGPSTGKFISKGEQICCNVMSKIYGKPFVSMRPNWLKNPETKRNLELDCYNEELKIAVEYNGIQHYQWPNFTNQSKEEFNNQVRRDELKLKLCDYYGIYLISVPYTVKPENIEAYIFERLPENIVKK